MSTKETYKLDKTRSNDDIFWRRVLQLAHHPHQQEFAPFVLNYCCVSTFTVDLPQNPLHAFDPRDYHRFRFKSETNFLRQFTESFERPPTTLVVNDLEHTHNIIGSSRQSLDIDSLREKLVHQGEVPNFSTLTKFWAKRESPKKIFERFNIDLDKLRQKPIVIKNPIHSLEELFADIAFKKFLRLKSTNISYLTIFPQVVKKLLAGLKHVDDVQALSLIRHYCKKATKHSENPVEFIKNIHLIFEEIKLLLAHAPYQFSDFRKAMEALFPDSTAYYAQSGSNALSSIVYALHQQKNNRLTVLTIGSKYYEEPLALNHTGHHVIVPTKQTLDLQLDEMAKDGNQVDLLRVDLKAAANGEKRYETYDVFEIVQKLQERELCSDVFSVVIDGTLNNMSDMEIIRKFRLIAPEINVVYFGSGVKTHCFGIDVATFGWMVARNPQDRFATFNAYLEKRSQHDVTDNPDFQFVSHLYKHCLGDLIVYQTTLLKQTQKIYDALKDQVEMASRENNPVPYLEFFGQTDIEALKARLSNTLLRYRGSFGFPYPTWLEIQRGDMMFVRVNCGLLTDEQTQVLIPLLSDIFAPNTCNEQDSKVEFLPF